MPKSRFNDRIKNNVYVCVIYSLPKVFKWMRYNTKFFMSLWPVERGFHFCLSGSMGVHHLKQHNNPHHAERLLRPWKSTPLWLLTVMGNTLKITWIKWADKYGVLSYIWPCKGTLCSSICAAGAFTSFALFWSQGVGQNHKVNVDKCISKK